MIFRYDDIEGYGRNGEALEKRIFALIEDDRDEFAEVAQSLLQTTLSSAASAGGNNVLSVAITAGSTAYSVGKGVEKVRRLKSYMLSGIRSSINSVSSTLPSFATLLERNSRIITPNEAREIEASLRKKGILFDRLRVDESKITKDKNKDKDIKIVEGYRSKDKNLEIWRLLNRISKINRINYDERLEALADRISDVTENAMRGLISTGVISPISSYVMNKAYDGVVDWAKEASVKAVQEEIKQQAEANKKLAEHYEKYQEVNNDILNYQKEKAKQAKIKKAAKAANDNANDNNSIKKAKNAKPQIKKTKPQKLAKKANSKENQIVPFNNPIDKMLNDSVAHLLQENAKYPNPYQKVEDALNNKDNIAVAKTNHQKINEFIKGLSGMPIAKKEELWKAMIANENNARRLAQEQMKDINYYSSLLEMAPLTKKQEKRKQKEQERFTYNYVIKPGAYLSSKYIDFTNEYPVISTIAGPAIVVGSTAILLGSGAVIPVALTQASAYTSGVLIDHASGGKISETMGLVVKKGGEFIVNNNRFTSSDEAKKFAAGIIMFGTTALNIKQDKALVQNLKKATTDTAKEVTSKSKKIWQNTTNIFNKKADSSKIGSGSVVKTSTTETKTPSIIYDGRNYPTEVNSRFPEGGGWYKPFPENRKIAEIVTNKDMKFYRVHLDKNFPPGRFLIREKEIKHLLHDPEKLRQYLGLKYVPKYITKANVPIGTKLHVGIIGPQPNFGLHKNSGVQYYLDKKIPKKYFTDTMLIDELVKQKLNKK